MFVDQNTSAGDCIDGDYIVTALENLNFIQQCSSVDTAQFFCERVDVEGTHGITFNATELCLDVATKQDVADPEAGAVIVKKVLHFVARYSSTNNGSSEASGFLTVARTVRVVCDGTTVKTLTRPEAIGLITVEFDCPDNADIQVCFDSRVTNTSDDFISARETIRICGALVCVKDSTSAESQGFLAPPNLDPQCNYGREALFLIYQNIASLRAKLAEGNQISGCEFVTHADLDEHVLINNPATEVSYLLLGFASATVQNAGTTADAYVTIAPRVSCGEGTLECLESTGTVPPAPDDGSAIPSIRVIGAALVDCGTCAAGENLTISYRSELVCNETPSRIISGVQTQFLSATQEYCLFTFTKAANEFEAINERVDNCINVATIQEAEQAARDLLALCESRSNVGTSSYEEEGLVAGASGGLVVVPAIVWPPALPLPRPMPDPPPVNKFWMNAYFQPCLAGGSFSSEETFISEGEMIIECGAVELYRFTTQWVLSRATNRSCGAGRSIKRCITCPADQPITLRFEGRAILGGFSAPNEFEYYINLFRYS